MIELVEVTRNTRGLNSREIKFNAVGKYTTKTVQKESKPDFDSDGKPKLDDKGNEIRIPLGKNPDGTQITYPEDVTSFESNGVLTDLADALALVDNDEQKLLDYFADGFNEAAYAYEANKDELDDVFNSLNLEPKRLDAVKRGARAYAKAIGMDVVKVAEAMKAQLAA